jgi:hypothetical protein
VSGAAVCLRNLQVPLSPLPWDDAPNKLLQRSQDAFTWKLSLATYRAALTASIFGLAFERSVGDGPFRDSKRSIRDRDKPSQFHNVTYYNEDLFAAPQPSEGFYIGRQYTATPHE